MRVECLSGMGILARPADDSFANELIDGIGVGFELTGALLSGLDGLTDLAHLRRDAGRRAVDLRPRGGGRMAGRQGVLAESELLDLYLDLLGGILELVLFGPEAGVLSGEVGNRLVQRHFAGESRTGSIVVAVGNGRAGRPIQLSALLGELGDLELDALATGGHIGHSAAYLLQQCELRTVALVEPPFERLDIAGVPVFAGPEDSRQTLPDAHVDKPTGRVTQVVDNSDGASGKGRATPSRKEAEAARKKQMKSPITRKEQTRKQKEARDAARGRTREAMRSGGDDKYLPLREQGPVRRFCRDYVDHRFNMAEVLLPILIVILLFSLINRPWASIAVLVLWTSTILITIIDEVFLVRGLRKELGARFEPGDTRGCLPYAVLRTTQLRRFRMPKPQVKRGEKLRERY